jgi:hypothetical protein
MAIVIGARLRFRSNGRGVGLPIALRWIDLKNRRVYYSCLGISADSDMCVGGSGVYALFSVFKVRAK